jgi:hypothetical protein
MLLFRKPYLLTFLDEVYTDAVRQPQKKSELNCITSYLLLIPGYGWWVRLRFFYLMQQLSPPQPPYS